MNAFKTGIHAKSLVLPSEKLADLEQLIEEYFQRHRPTSPEARLFVDDLIHCEWTLRRLRTAETQLYQFQNNNIYSNIKEAYPLGNSANSHSSTFTKLQYRVDATRRAVHRALQALEKLKADSAPVSPNEPDPPALRPPSLNPSPQTTSPQNGFVPVTPIPAPLPTAPPAPCRPEPTGTSGEPFETSPVAMCKRTIGNGQPGRQRGIAIGGGVAQKARH
jgi:hypothetical protein